MRPRKTHFAANILLPALKTVMVLTLLLTFEQAQAQKYREMMDDMSVNVRDVEKEAEAYFKTIDKKAKGSGWKQYQRWLYENKVRYYPSGDRSQADPYFAVKAAKKFRRDNPVPKNLFPNGWEDLGPYNLGQITVNRGVGLGRVEASYIDPNNAQRMFLGSRSGGFWKTTDGGATWTQTTDFLFATGVNTITVSPANSNEVLINVRNGWNEATHGIYRSINAGDTWTLTEFNPANLGWGGLGTRSKINKIAYHPSTANLIFIASSRGLFRSADNLATSGWTNPISGSGSDIIDIAFHPTDPNFIYVATRFEVYYSNDGGITFSPSASGDGGYRLSTSANCPDCVFAVSANSERAEIWKSTDKGVNYTKISDASNGLPDKSYFAEFNANYGGFAVNELDIKNILFGGINVHMTSNEGMSFNRATGTQNFNNGEFVHADIRAAENHNGVFWVMTDGFLAKSTDNGVNWEYFEGHGIRENYRLGVSQSNHYRTIVGSQDNGTSIKTENGWIEFFGGDGMEGIIHPLNDDWMIGSTQNGEVRPRTKDGGLTYEDVSPTGGGSFWIAPLLYDPNDPMTIYSMERDVYKSEDFGTTWTNVGTPSFANPISVAAIAPNSPNVILAIDSDFISEFTYGPVEKSVDGGQTFFSIRGTAPNALPGGFITDAAFDPLDDNVIVVTYGDEEDNNNKVFISNDQGGTWQNITYNLSNMPVRSVVVDHTDESNIYLGTEIGVYKKAMADNSWSLYGPDLPNVTVNELDIVWGSNTLRAATWGRGLWEYTLCGRENYPAILTTELTEPPSDIRPRVGVDQYVTSTISSDNGLANVYVKWSIGAPTLDNTIAMSNIGGDAWRTNSPFPNQAVGAKVYFKVYAENNSGQTTETYRFSYTVKPFIWAPCREADSLALVDFYNNAGGPNWTVAWDLNQPMDTWFGVEFNLDGCVTCVDLDGNPDCATGTGAGNNLTGTFPLIPSYGFTEPLKNLEVFSISQNQLSGCLPTDLDYFSKLQILLLDHNQFDGSVPGQWGNLTNLQRMDLSFNQLECFKPGLAALCFTSAQVTANNNPGGLDWNAFCATGAGGCPESAVLEALYNATDGDNWTRNDNWLNGGDPCDPDAPWYGITCDCKGSITEIFLRNNNLIGFIPPELGLLSDLIELNLGFSDIGPSIPVELGNLINLRVLDLEQAQLSGNIPVELGDLANLINLRLSFNQLTGNIPVELGDLTKLETLGLAQNQLSGGIPPQLGNLTDLQEFWLFNNQLSGVIPSELNNLINLTYLLLNDNQLSGSIPPELGDLVNLEGIDLSMNQLSGGIPPQFGSLANLGTINLSSNLLTGSIPPELGNLSAFFVQLDFSNNQLTGSIPGELGNLSASFIELDFSNNLLNCFETGLNALCNLFPTVNVANNPGNLDWDAFCMNGAGDCCTQSEALIALYDATGGDNWTNNTNWLNGMDPCDSAFPWFGVFCDGNGNVEEIRLDFNGLTGSIPSDLECLSQLRSLSLWSNNLSGPIPPEIGRLSKLEALELTFNQLSGNIPVEFTNLANLRFLGLGFNQLTGGVPPELGQLGSLEGLGLQNNSLTGKIPPELGGLVSLLELNLAGNQLNGNIPEELANLFNLEFMALNDNQLSCFEEGLNALCNAPNLQGVDVFNNPGNLDWDAFCMNGDGACCVQIDGLIALYDATGGDNWTNNTNWLTAGDPCTWFGVDCDGSGNITRIILPQNNLVGSIPPEIECLTELTLLDLRENQLSGPIPPEFGNLTNLTRVVFFDNQLSGPLPPQLGNLINLEGLFFDLNQIWGPIPPELGNLTQLTELVFYGNILSGPIPPELGNLTNLTQLNLAYNQLSNEIPAELGALTNLNFLYLNNNQFTCFEAGVDALCPTGVQVDVSNNPGNLDWATFCSSGVGACCSQLEALTALYNQTDGDNWTNNSGWLSGSPCNAAAPWFGVSCDGAGNITEIDLSGNGLNGTIPAELKCLTDLMRLNLNNNQLTGNIPPELGSLANLTYLGLSGNQLNGAIPLELGNLGSLTQLLLGVNQLTGNIPPELGNLSQLTELYLDNNQLTGPIPIALGGLTNLQLLWLFQNQLSGAIPPELGNLNNLISLRIPNNQLSGAIPPQLGNLANLTDLGLGSNQLTGAIPPELANLSQLTGLYLDNNQLSGPIPRELGDLTNLEFLWLGVNQLSGEIPSHLGNLLNIQQLFLNDNQLDCIGPGLDALCGLGAQVSLANNPGGLDWNAFCASGAGVCCKEAALTALYNTTDGDNWTNNTNWLNGMDPCDAAARWFGISCDGVGNITGIDLVVNGLNGMIPSELECLTNLTTIDLLGNQLSGAVPPELGNLPNLQVLSLSNNQLTGSIPPELGNLMNLLGLGIFNNQLSGPIPPELGNLTNLEFLGLFNNQLSGSIPSALGNLINLQTLTLNDNLLECFGPGLNALCNNGVLNTVNVANNPGNLDWNAFCASGAGSCCSQEEALIALYNATDGANWTDNTNWLNGMDPCDAAARWFGISCDGSGNITQIILGGNGLNGALPSELECLTHLTRLDLLSNQLSGSIPPELGLLSNLTYLDLSGNQLTGSIPPELGDLSNLQYLYCENNQLSGSIPSELGNLTQLLWIWLYSNQLSGSIPPELGGLTNVQRLYLYSNQLSGSIPPELGGLTNMQRLYLYSNQLSGSIPPELGGLTNLERLYLDLNELSGAIPPQLGGLTSLTQLLLNGNQLGGSIPPELGNLTNLQFLWLRNNQLSGEIPSELANLAQLQELLLNDNQLECFGAGLNALCNNGVLNSVNVANNPGNLDWDAFCATGAGTCCKVAALTALYHATDGDNWTNNANWLNGMDPCDAAARWFGISCDGVGNITQISMPTNGLNGSLPAELACLTDLTLLNLRDNQLIGNIPPELGALTQLTRLDLLSNQLSGSIPPELGNLTNLQELWLSGNQLGGSIPPELSNLTNLRQLWLFTNQLSGSIPPELGNLSNLEWLLLSENQLSGSIPSELSNLTNLQILWLNDNQLSCFEPELSALCNNGVLNTVDVSNNPGNLNWNDFCNTGAGTCCKVAALTALYNATDGANWTDNTNWLNGLDPCDPASPWFGITCDGSGNVTEIFLDANGLNGSIPPELECLTELRMLWLGSNQLSGSVPIELANLVNLETLALQINQLTGTIPPELENLTNLTTLYLNNNQLNGSIPVEIGNLTNLTRLFLSGNQLSGGIPVEIGNLINLNSLNLNSNELNGSIPPQLGNLVNLTDLNLTGNQLSGSIPAEIGNLVNIQILRLGVNPLSGSIPPELGNLTNLFWLELLNAQLSGEIPSELGNLVNLQILRLNDNQLTCFGAGLNALCNNGVLNTVNVANNPGNLDWNAFCASGAGECCTQNKALTALYNSTSGANWTDNTNWLNGMDPCDAAARWFGISCDGSGNITEINLGGNGLNGVLPPELECLTDLRVLDLLNNQLNGAIPPELGLLSNLTYLDLSGNQLTGSLPSELGMLGNLQAAYFENNQLSGSIPSELGNLSDLQVLWAFSNQLSGAIPPSLGNLFNLQQLNIFDNQLSGAIPSDLGNLANLTHLVLGINQLTGLIPPELGNLSNLAFLYLDNNQLSGVVPAELSNLSNLQLLFLHTNQLTCFEEGLNALCNNGVLNSVNVANNPGNLDWNAFCATGEGVCEGVQVSPVVFLQGPYDPNTGLMRDLLRSNGILPLNEPFTGLGYTHVGGGGESAAPGVFNVVGSDAIVDWVFVELRDKTDYTIVKATRSALLQTDGDVVDVDGVSPVSFSTLADDDYYVVVKHRNHLGVMSATSLALSGLPVVVDFTSDLNNTFGGINGIAALGDGNFGLYSGDFNHSGQIQNTDLNFMIPTLGVPAGYLPGDHDLNGQVQNTDLQLKLIPNIGRGQPFGS